MTMADTWEKVCERCGKTMRVEMLTIAYQREREEANYQVCGAQIASKMCSTIAAHVIKKV